MSKKTPKLPSELLADRLKKKGWAIVENVKPSKFEVKDLELVSILKDGEESVDGDTMRQRATNLKANFGLDDAKYILDHQAEIPVEFRGKYLIFPGTLFDCMHIPSIRWEDGKWQFGFIPVSFGFNYGDDDLLVRSKHANKGQA
ncbi:MAG: hypothetical protein G01um101413_676 [Parcubacteria group bacterium Gr01-1014_13]|nr:MAG: hypothetical protein G01um101413_676 [Parcubacteria group bacterium Gr01-1014_13]